jgi:hypothetical protein
MAPTSGYWLRVDQCSRNGRSVLRCCQSAAEKECAGGDRRSHQQRRSSCHALNPCVSLRRADLEQPRPAREIASVQLAVLSLQCANDVLQLSGVDRERRGKGRRVDVVDQGLPIMELAQDLLCLSQIAQRAAGGKHSSRIGNLGSVTPLLDGDTGAMQAVREVDAGRMSDPVGRIPRPRSKPAPDQPTPGRTDAMDERYVTETAHLTRSAQQGRSVFALELFD